MLKFLKLAVLFVGGLLLSTRLACAETVKIIAEDAWFPYSGVMENGLEGIAVDIVKEAYKAEGVDVEYIIMNYDRCLQEVKDGKAVGCFDVGRTKEIENDFLWHDAPLFNEINYYYVPSDFVGKISRVDDLKDKKIGLTQGYQYSDEIDLNNTINKEYSKTDEIILKKLIAKRLDVIILYKSIADYLIAKENAQDKVRQEGQVNNTELYIGFSKSHPDGKKYCDIFSQGLKAIKDNGAYQKIFDRWNAKLKGAGQNTVSKEEAKPVPQENVSAKESAAQ